jgi:DNA polymerase III psi subunit
MNKQEQINAWRATQGLAPIGLTGKTAKARASGALKQTQSNKQARAQYCRDLKSLRSTSKKGK